jgi:hypothetical protein
MIESRSNREKKERYEMFKQLKEDAAGDPEKLREIEIIEIKNRLIDDIMDKVFEILIDQDSDDLYKGAFKDNKPDQEKLTECLLEHGYMPNIYDEKVLNIVAKLSKNPKYAFLLNHGISKEAEIQYEQRSR